MIPMMYQSLSAIKVFCGGACEESLTISQRKRVERERELNNINKFKRSGDDAQVSNFSLKTDICV